MTSRSNAVEAAKTILAQTPFCHAELDRLSEGNFVLELRNNPEREFRRNQKDLPMLTEQDQTQIDGLCDEHNRLHGTASTQFERARRAIRLTTYRTIQVTGQPGRPDIIILAFFHPTRLGSSPRLRVTFEYGKTDLNSHDLHQLEMNRSRLRKLCKEHTHASNQAA